MKNRLKKEIDDFPESVVAEVERGFALINAFRSRVESREARESQERDADKNTSGHFFNETGAKCFRNLVAHRIWEPDLRSELVDRIVTLVDMKVVTPKEVEEIILKAQEKKKQYADTDGVKGSQSIWMTVGSWAKNKWEGAGRIWYKTSPRLEPKPTGEYVSPFRRKQEPVKEQEPSRDDGNDDDKDNGERVTIDQLPPETLRVLNNALNFNKTDSIL